MLAEITFIRKPGDPPEVGGGPIIPDQVWPPNGIPPLPPIEGLPPGWWTKPPGEGLWPIKPPDWPIVIPLPPIGGRPDHGLPGEKPPVVGGGPVQPPSVPPVVGGGPIEPPTIWPPLPPDAGIAGRALILIWVVGVGYRWLVVDCGRVTPPIYLPPEAQPKK